MKHHCHWPNCIKSVPPRMWGCRTHWFTLPKQLRDAIWRYYRKGQEIDKRPSTSYLVIAKACDLWAREFDKTKPKSDARKALRKPFAIKLAVDDAKKFYNVTEL